MGILPLALAQDSSEAAASAAVGIGLIFGIIGFIVGIAFLIFWIWTIVDCAKRQFPGDNDKIIWLVVIILLGVLGSLIYLIAGRSKGTLPSQSAPTPPSGPVEPSK